jgi:GNAT superfamily N-acetyltransferase
VLKIESLDASHDRGGFDCGVEPLNAYLRQVARQHIAKDIARTYVLVDEESRIPKPLLGFFTLSICQVHAEDIPPKWVKKLPASIPAIRLGRLAVAKSHQGAGLGKSLLVEAIYKTAQASELTAGIGLFVDAKDAEAASFYSKFGFQGVPGSPLKLFMPMETVRQFVAVDAGKA